MSRIIIEDASWRAIMEDPQLANARRKLSFHEIRLIVQHARDTDGSPKGPDRNGLDGEAATGGAEGIAETQPQTQPPPIKGRE